MVEYRPVPEGDIEAFRAVLDYAFRPEAGPQPDRDDDPPPLGDRRGLYDGDELVSTAAHHDLTLLVRDRWLAVAGLSAVATLPEHRRRGLVRKLLVESLEEYRERGQHFSVLWPFKHSFYRRFGWGRLADLGRYEFEPNAVAAVADHPLAGGEFRRLEKEDFPTLQALDDRFADRYDLTMRRTEDWYRYRFFEGRESDPFVYGWFQESTLRGYLRYDVEHDGDDRELRVFGFGAPDETMAVNLFRFLHRHQDQADRVRVYAPVDDLLFDLVEDPREVELEVLPGPMGRLVDVPSGIEALPAPAGVDRTLTLAVRDGLADWNDARFALSVADGAFEVERIDAHETDAEVPIETLSRLAFGATTAERAAVSGHLEADDSVVARLGELFPPRDGYLREFF